eukprot:68794-Chlamydomonas_euryale.AAC.1
MTDGPWMDWMGHDGLDCKTGWDCVCLHAGEAGEEIGGRSCERAGKELRRSWEGGGEGIKGRGCEGDGKEVGRRWEGGGKEVGRSCPEGFGALQSPRPPKNTPFEKSLLPKMRRSASRADTRSSGSTSTLASASSTLSSVSPTPSS